MEVGSEGSRLHVVYTARIQARAYYILVSTCIACGVMATDSLKLGPTNAIWQLLSGMLTTGVVLPVAAVLFPDGFPRSMLSRGYNPAMVLALAFSAVCHMGSKGYTTWVDTEESAGTLGKWLARAVAGGGLGLVHFWLAYDSFMNAHRMWDTIQAACRYVGAIRLVGCSLIWWLDPPEADSYPPDQVPFGVTMTLGAWYVLWGVSFTAARRHSLNRAFGVPVWASLAELCARSPGGARSEVWAGAVVKRRRLWHEAPQLPSVHSGGSGLSEYSSALRSTTLSHHTAKLEVAALQMYQPEGDARDE